MRILYVEDNLANVSLVRRVAQNHEVVNYIDGEEALRDFDTIKPDMVLMDVQLAGRLSGLDVVKKLREAGHKIPIIALTAYAMVGDRERCLAAGCDDYIPKPLPIPRLVELFREHANRLGDKTNDAETKVSNDTQEVASTPSLPDADSSSDTTSSDASSTTTEQAKKDDDNTSGNSGQETTPPPQSQQAT